MKENGGHSKEGITELFQIAEKNPKLARKIYELSKSEAYHFGEIEPYLNSASNQSLSLAALIAMDNFGSELSTEHLVGFQRSADSLIGARARVLVIRRKPIKSEYNFLVDAQRSPLCSESANLARELLLIWFGGKLPVDLLFEFQKSSCKEIRNDAKTQLLKRPQRDFSSARLSALLKEKYVSELAAELLLRKFPRSLNFIDLIEFQLSPSEIVQSLARMLALEMQKDDLIFEVLVKYREKKDPRVRDIAIELIIKNFDSHLTGSDILSFQDTKNDVIRGLGRDLALSLPPSRWIRKTIKKGKVSHSFFIRKLAGELEEKFSKNSGIDKEARDFIVKFGF